MRISIGAKLSGAMLMLAVVPLAVATAVIARDTAQRIKEGARRYQLATADAAETMVWTTLDAASRELKAVGGPLGQVERPLEDTERLARAALLASTYIDHAAVYTPQGELLDTLVDAARETAPDPPARLDAELRGMATEHGAAWLGTVGTVAPGTVAPGTVAPGTVAPGSRLAIPVVVPIYRSDGKGLMLFLRSEVSLVPLNALFGTLSRRRFGDEANRVFVVDHALRVVVHPESARLGTSMAHDGATRDLDVGGAQLAQPIQLENEYERGGEPLLGTVSSIPDLRWGIVVEQNRDDAYAPVAATVWRAVWVAGAFALLAIAVGLLLSRRLTRPVVAVSKAAERVAKGDFSVRVSGAGAHDEVGDMERSFNKMAGDLEGYEVRVVEEARIRNDLSRYLNQEVVESVIRAETELRLGGERREVTVLFADVVGFTPLVEEHDPERVVAILNELFTFATDIVFRHGGIIDKFMGDCVMAVFGTPTALPDGPSCAVRAAEEIMNWLEVGNARWATELGRPLEMGIGIHTGSVVAGNIGSEKRMEYTVIGAAVNLAARLESIALPGQVLMTAETAGRVSGEFDCVAIGTRELTGTGKPTEIWSLQD